MCFLPEGHGKAQSTAACGCMRHWDMTCLNEMAKDARKHDSLAMREFIDFTPPPKSDVPLKLFDTASLRQAGKSSELGGKAPVVYYHAVRGKAASKHWRPAWVTDSRADPDDAVADVSGQWRETKPPRAEIVGPGHAAQEPEAYAEVTLWRTSLQNAR